MANIRAVHVSKSNPAVTVQDAELFLTRDYVVQQIIVGDGASITTEGTGSISSTVPANIKASEAGITIDGGGSTPTTGSKGFLVFPANYSGTITGWTMLGDVSGSAQITVKKCTFAGFPTTSSIVASAPPALVTQQKATSTTLTGWTTAITAGDIWEFNLDSIATINRVVLALSIQRT